MGVVRILHGGAHGMDAYFLKCHMILTTMLSANDLKRNQVTMMPPSGCKTPEACTKKREGSCKGIALHAYVVMRVCVYHGVLATKLRGKPVNQ